jgi:hypothetical protein
MGGMMPPMPAVIRLAVRVPSSARAAKNLRDVALY